MATYQDTYGEPEAQHASAKFSRGSFAHVIAIGAYGEGESLFELLSALPTLERDGPLLVVLLINARETSPAWVHDANRDALKRIASTYDHLFNLSEAPGIAAYQMPNDCVLLCIDRASEGAFLPEGQGVGLARKITADVAHALIESEVIQTRFIHCTDADVVLPPHYLQRIAHLDAKTSAAIYPFVHRLETEHLVAQSMLRYEIALRYYVLGLQHAKSPYAFHTVGSTMAVSAKHYALVRGFPKRQAGEDFYMLNKLAKVGRVAELRGDPIELAGRLSERVPFGTGAALHKAVNEHHEGKAFVLYHPLVFDHLAAWYAMLEQFINSPHDWSLTQALETVTAARPHLDRDALAKAAKAFELEASFVTLHKNAPRRDTCERQVHTWFDAFRVLKFVHCMRDHGLPSLPFSEALQHASFLPADCKPKQDGDLHQLRAAFFAHDYGDAVQYNRF